MKRISLEKAETMIPKFHCSIDRELFEKIVHSNPALLRKVTWEKMWENFWEELFPRSSRKFSLGLTFASVVLAVVFSWNLFFSPLTETILVRGETPPITVETVETVEKDTLNNDEAWQENLSSLVVGKFWVENVSF